MKKVFIKYNPYKLETEITVNGKRLAENSKLREKTVAGSRLQEWVEELPNLLKEEYNDTEFNITFHGTLLDYEDLGEAMKAAYEHNGVKAGLKRRPAKETADKELLIDKVFQEIQKGPFEELRTEDIVHAFEHAKSSDFEVCVVATMSAGKSTLINAMLGEKLMPSKQEACTAIITKIKDTKKDTWNAEVYNKSNQLIETHENLSYPTMERLNGDEKVSVIKVNGNIPFVSSEDVSLVLVDTPGRNNARDPEHKRVQSEFLKSSSKSLILYVMEGTFGSDSDDEQLRDVAESMSVGGKQSKDRFIFVINKMDNRQKEDGDTEQTLERVREYLKKHGIENPNLFPIAALPALNIRMMESKTELDEDTIDETELKVRKLNRNENLHLESFSTLPGSVRGMIQDKLRQAEESENSNEQALIHTGLVSVEAAIRQYVQKYAKTAKIKNIVDTFMHKLDEIDCFETTKKEIAANQEEAENIARQIREIKQKINDIKATETFHNTINGTIKTMETDSKEKVESVMSKFENRLTKRIDSLRGVELSRSEAEDEMESMKRFAKRLQPEFQTELDDMIQDTLIKTATGLM